MKEYEFSEIPLKVKFNKGIKLFLEKCIQKGYKNAFVSKILSNISNTERLNKLTNKKRKKQALKKHR